MEKTFIEKFNDQKALEDLIQKFESDLVVFKFKEEEIFKLKLTVDELGINALSYTSNPESVYLKYKIGKECVCLEIQNEGNEFNWKEKTSEEYLKKINDEMQIGGRGIYLASQYMDELNYEFKKGLVIVRAEYHRKDS